MFVNLRRRLAAGAWGSKRVGRRWRRGELPVVLLLGCGLLSGGYAIARADAPLLAATQVIGQPDFTTSGLRPASADSFRSDATALDTARHRLFVADDANYRVLVFGLDAQNGTVNSTASYVLGKPNFTSSGFSSGAAGMGPPVGLAFDAVNNRLFVSDWQHCRVMVFELSGGLSNGMAAAHVLGAPSLTADGCDVYLGRADFEDPFGLAFDPSSELLYVTDDTVARVLVFNVNPATFTNGENASYVIGQPDFDSSNYSVSRNGLSVPESLAVDAPGHRLFVADSYSARRVLVYDTSALSNGMNASFVLGEPDFTSSSGGGSNANSFDPIGLVYDSPGQRLFVEDGSIARVLSFDTSSISNGMNATGVIGESDPSAGGNPCEGTSSTQLCSLDGFDDAYDPAQNQLYVSDRGNNRVLVFKPPRPVDPFADAPDGAAISTCGTTPVLRAKAVSGSGVQYEFQVATSSSFASGTIVADSGLIRGMNTYAPPPGSLASGSTYYWRWKTATGSYTTARSFSINLPHVGAGPGSGPLWSHAPLAVNEVSGNLLVSMPGPSYPSESGGLAAGLSYNSQLASDTGLGSGWLLDAGGSSAGAPVQLIDHNLLDQSQRMDAVEARFADGSSTCFTHVADTGSHSDPGDYTAGPGSDEELSRNAEGASPTRAASCSPPTRVDGRTANPSSIHSLDAAAGTGTLTYTYSTEEPTKVTSLSDDTGRSLSFAWNSLDPSGCPSAIVCVTGPDGVTWTYAGADPAEPRAGWRRSTTVRGRSSRSPTTRSGLVNKVQNADDLDPRCEPGYNGAHALTVGYDSRAESQT